MELNHWDKWWIVLAFTLLFILLSLSSTYLMTSHICEKFGMSNTYTKQGPSDYVILIHVILFIIGARIILEMIK
jgi:hypothetical protein